MSDYLKELLNKRNLINVLFLAILVLTIPLTINLVRRQQILNSRAATDSVQLVDNECTIIQDNKKVLTCPTVTLNFVAPTEVDVLSAQVLVKQVYAQDCISGSAGAVTAAQAKCVLQKRSDILPFYQQNNWCIEEANKPGIINNWISINNQADKNEVAECLVIPTAAPTSAPTIAPTPTSAPTGSTCPTRPLQDIGNEELIAKCTLAEIALLPNERLETFPLSTITLLSNDRLMQMSLVFLAKLPNERLGLFSLEFLGKFPNDRLKTFTIEFLQKFSNDRLITFPLDVLAQFPADRIITFPCEIQIQLGYKCSTQNIVKVIYAFNQSDLTNPNLRHEIPYKTGGTGAQKITFSDTNGTKFIFAQFVDNKGAIVNANPFPFKIDLVGPVPQITSLACEVDIVNSSDLLFMFTGTNFGASQGTGTVTLKGGVKLVSPAEVWSDTAVVMRLKSPPVSETTSGTQYFATLTNNSGQKSAEQQCLVGITQISLGAKLFCRSQRNFDQDNVELVLVSDKNRNQKSSEKVTIDKEGNIVNIKSKLKAGDNYIACIKAPLSVRKCSAPFTASSGTNIITMNLPVGDYNGDGSINSVDGSLLKGQWGPVNSTKNCDVNKDKFCNSFEWSCMVHDFNISDQKEL